MTYYKYNLSKDGVVRVIPTDKFGDIESSIYQILNTFPKERVQEINFGSRLRALLFRPADEFFAVEVKKEIKTAINKEEDRIIVTGVDVKLPDENATGVQSELVTVIIRYVYRQGEQGEKELQIPMSVG